MSGKYTKSDDYTTLNENPWFSVRSQKVTALDSSQQLYYIIHFPRPAVGIVACRDNSILLLRQYRVIIDEFVWAIPSGGIEEGESPDQAARRELEEETGHQAGRVSQMLDCYASYGCSDQRFILFRADDLTDTGKGFDRNEVLETKWFTHDEVRELIFSNRIVDNLSLAPLLMVLVAAARQ